MEDRAMLAHSSGTQSIGEAWGREYVAAACSHLSWTARGSRSPSFLFTRFVASAHPRSGQISPLSEPPCKHLPHIPWAGFRKVPKRS